MEPTIPLEDLLDLIAALAPPESADLVALSIDALGLGGQEAFTRADFLAVLSHLTRYGQRLVRDPAQTPGASDAQRAHMAAMLEAVSAHAMPVLQDAEPAAQDAGGATVLQEAES
ncbi:MAG: hypothetical protein VKS61_04845 [Candidatus Sericytochromatia bacterium]|nr:hypothetical protein [Candidatus Sericytochromatia bacterium]MEB3221385.1 hypothetical protein [Candidatus Sericytochromatia bacterium]